MHCRQHSRDLEQALSALYSADPCLFLLGLPKDFLAKNLLGPPDLLRENGLFESPNLLNGLLVLPCATPGSDVGVVK